MSTQQPHHARNNYVAHLHSTLQTLQAPFCNCTHFAPSTTNPTTSVTLVSAVKTGAGMPDRGRGGGPPSARLPRRQRQRRGRLCQRILQLFRCIYSCMQLNCHRDHHGNARLGICGCSGGLYASNASRICRLRRWLRSSFCVGQCSSCVWNASRDGLRVRGRDSWFVCQCDYHYTQLPLNLD